MTTPVAQTGPTVVQPSEPDLGSPVIPLLLIGAGFYLMWFAVKYWRGSGPAVWPSYPVKSVLQGKGIPANVPAGTAEAELDVLEQGGAAADKRPVWPFPGGIRSSEFRRVDQGWDLQFPGTAPTPVLAAAPGTLEKGGPDPGGFGPGYPVLRLDAPVLGYPAVYYGHTFVEQGKIGKHVAAGEQIGTTGGAHSGGNAFGDPNWLEIGFWDRGPVAKGASGATRPGLQIQAWLERGLPGEQPVSGKPQNQARLLLGGEGWGSEQFPPLVSLWTRESNWNPQARNPSSGALGIAQALGHGQPDTAGTLGNEYGAQYGLTAQDAQAANSGNALQQIRWGLGYVKDRYGSPQAAWQHETTFGWY